MQGLSREWSPKSITIAGQLHVCNIEYKFQKTRKKRNQKEVRWDREDFLGEMGFT